MESHFEHIVAHTAVGSQAEYFSRLATTDYLSKIHAGSPEQVILLTMTKIRSNYPHWIKIISIGRALVAYIYADSRGMLPPQGFVRWPSQREEQIHLAQKTMVQLNRIALQVRTQLNILNQVYIVLNKDDKKYDVEPLWRKSSYARLVLMVECLSTEMELLSSQLSQFTAAIPLR